MVELTARYERQIARLEARVERLEDKLRENSRNSSRPPSSDPPGGGCQPRPSSDRRQGGQPGHEGTTRRLVPESELDEIVEHWPERCSGCGRDFVPGEREPAGEPHRHKVAELPPIAVRVTEHRAHSVRCRGCGLRTRAELPGGIGRSALGPRLQAAVALLSVRNIDPADPDNVVASGESELYASRRSQSPPGLWAEHVATVARIAPNLPESPRIRADG